jgi:hypothetical protein
MDQIEALRCEHQLIDKLAAELASFVAGPTPPEPVAFLQLRRAFGRTLSAHLKREDWIVYPRLRAHARGEVRDLAHRFCTAAAALSTAFAAYGQFWTTSAIADDWKGFQAATAAMLASLDDRIAMEEDELYPLLAEAGDAAPPWRAKVSVAPSPAAPRLAGRALNPIASERSQHSPGQ